MDFVLIHHQKKDRQKRKIFTPEEDEKLKEIMNTVEFSNWDKVAAIIGTRTSRQCRDRWMNYLSPDNNHDPWTSDEDAQIIQKVMELGKRWSYISKFFPGRSDNAIKNRWYSHLQKKHKTLFIPQRQPITNQLKDKSSLQKKSKRLIEIDHKSGENSDHLFGFWNDSIFKAPLDLFNSKSQIDLFDTI